MREPSDLFTAFAFWRDALDGKRPTITHEPQCGFFQRRFVRGGVWVPVAIWLDQKIEDGELVDDEIMLCLVNGKWEDPEEVWTHCAGNPITESEYRFLEARHQWARVHAPDDPFARPSERVDPLSVQPVF